MVQLRPTATSEPEPGRIVVVGNGMVSLRLCKALERHGLVAGGNVCVLGEEAHPAYDRIRLSQSLDQPIDDLLLSPAGWYAEAGIDLRLGQGVVAIDRDRRQVRLTAGESVPYDTLVLATGSVPFVPASLAVPEGLPRKQVHVFREYRDLEDLRLVAEPGTRFGVVGGGLLGLETAKVLRDRDCQIHLIEAGGHLMSRQLDVDSAAVLEAHVRGLGVETHLGCITTSVSIGEPDAYSSTPLVLTFEGEQPPLVVDHLVIAAGIRPRDELARDAGLDVGVRGGVLVDGHLRSSDPSIYAIGECACVKGECYGLVSPGYAMADTLAARMAGEEVTFEGADNSCQLKLMGMPVSAAGLYDQEASTLLGVAVDGGRRTLVMDGRRVIGATSVGSWPQLPRLQDAIERGLTLSQSQRRRFAREGEVFGGSDLTTVESWPATTTVCNCEGVTRGQLSACISAGCRDVDAIGEKTGAGRVCGSCKPLLSQMLGERGQPARVPGRLTVLVISALSLFLASGYVLLEPVPFAASVQAATRELDQFWRDDILKQWTGYGLVGITVLGGLLSARKRFKWFSLGSFGLYRALHTITGLIALGGLLAHTGMRFGSNLNFALMTLFVGLGVVGGLAGVATALETNPTSAWAQRARRARRPLTWSHVLLFWPLPLLLGLHVFAVYYF